MSQISEKEYLVRRLREVPGVEVRVVYQHGERILVEVKEVTSSNVSEYFTVMLDVLKHTREMLRHSESCLMDDFDVEVCRILKIDSTEQSPCCHRYHVRHLRWDDGSVQEAVERLPHVVVDYLAFALVEDSPLTAVV